MATTRPVLAALVAGAAVMLTGCGSTDPAGDAAPRPPAATPAPHKGEDGGTTGTWTSTTRLHAPVGDSRTVAGTTRAPGEPTHAVALDAATGTTRWDVPLGRAADALLGTPELLLPDGLLLASLRQGTPGTDGGWQVARLDPDTGRTLWSVTTTGPAVDAGPRAVLGEARQGTSTEVVGAVALDPADGRTLWTSVDRPVLAEGATAVLSHDDDGGTGTWLRAVDGGTGRTLWAGPDRTPGTAGSRAVALAATADRLFVTQTTTGMADTTTRLLLLGLATGTPVGPGLPAAPDTTVLLDPDSGTAVVQGPRDDGTATVTGIDPADGRMLWTLENGRATDVEQVGGGLAWVRTSDGRYAAVDDRTGTVRADRLDQAPVLVTGTTQVVDDGAVLRTGPLA